jgi:hypothetical protein
MKNQIDKLVKLAERYADLAREVSMPRNNHNHVRGSSLNHMPSVCEIGGRISVWLTMDMDNWYQVVFDNVTITAFGEPTITIKASETEESLDYLHDDLETYLEGILIPNKLTIAEHYGKESKKDIEEKINKLKEELKRYENLQG